MIRAAALLILLATPALAGERISGPVTHVRDADTIVVGSVPVRLSGVAAPEYNARNPERSEPGGAEATAAMVQIVAGRIVTCDLSGERTHDRMVGVCYVDGVDLGAAIVAAGFARDCPRFSGTRYAAAEVDASRALPLPGYCTPR